MNQMTIDKSLIGKQMVKQILISFMFYTCSDGFDHVKVLQLEVAHFVLW